jgi:hypothetical protein
MKRRIYFIIPFCLLAICLTAQEPVKKSKQELKLEKQKETEDMLMNKTFVFVARSAFPSAGRQTSITSGASTVKFQPELITSDLPFFGTAYSGVGYGGQGGMKFEGKPEKFTVEKTKKSGYEITAVVKTTEDSYNIILTAGSDGYASLSIHSNNRSSMSYSGVIEKPEVKK